MRFEVFGSVRAFPHFAVGRRMKRPTAMSVGLFVAPDCATRVLILR